MPENTLLVSFAERHPILVPALRDIYRFSKTQLSMNAVLAIIAIPVSNHYGLLTDVQLGPAIKAFLLIYLALLLATGAFNFIRSPLRLLASHHRQLMALDQLRLGKNAPSQYAGTPDIEFTNPEIIEGWFHAATLGLTREKPPHDQSAIKVQVMLVRLYYKPDRAVPPFLNLKAHMSIADVSGNPIKARYDAVWDTGQESAYKLFHTADIHELIIALFIGTSVCTYEYGWRDGNFKPEFNPLNGNSFRIRLELIGKHESDAVLNKFLEFSLKADPPSMSLI
jgi:hypothetical protein